MSFVGFDVRDLIPVSKYGFMVLTRGPARSRGGRASTSRRCGTTNAAAWRWDPGAQLLVEPDLPNAPPFPGNNKVEPALLQSQEGRRRVQSQEGGLLLLTPRIRAVRDLPGHRMSASKEASAAGMSPTNSGGASV